MTEEWAILELMGHVRIAGKVTEEERFGSKIGRIDVPIKSGGFVTQYFGGASVYRMTIVSDDVAKAVAFNNEPSPIHAYEMPRPSLSFGDDKPVELDENGNMPIPF